MTDTEIREQVDAFVALPRAERRAQYPKLPREVQLRARKIIEARRGISYRSEGGIPVFTKEETIRQIVQKQEKLNDNAAWVATTEANIVELKKQLQENHGDEALAEAEVEHEKVMPNKTK